TLSRLGIAPGNRVGTLAWNGYRHFELYYAISGMGAITHTINPRLFHEQLAYIIDDAEDGIVFFDLTFTPLVEKLAAACKGVKHGACDRADVSRQRLGDSLRGAADRCQARVSGRRARWRKPLRADRSRGRRQHFRGADGMDESDQLHAAEQAQVLDAQVDNHRRGGVSAGDDQDIAGRIRRVRAAR